MKKTATTSLNLNNEKVDSWLKAPLNPHINKAKTPLDLFDIIYEEIHRELDQEWVISKYTCKLIWHIILNKAKVKRGTINLAQGQKIKWLKDFAKNYLIKNVPHQQSLQTEEVLTLITSITNKYLQSCLQLEY